MKITATVNETQIDLNIHSPQEHSMTDAYWGMRITRADGASDPKFGESGVREISVLEVQQFFPHAGTIQFDAPKLNDSRNGFELRAVEGHYAVTLFFPNDRNFQSDKVVANFRSIFSGSP